MVTCECDIRCGHCGQCYTYECNGCGETTPREEYRDGAGLCESCADMTQMQKFAAHVMRGGKPKEFAK